MPEKWDLPSEFGPCSCSQLRRTARKVSSLYDAALAACGLSVTQHAVLVSVARAAKISRTELAARLGMERTTLTRNLKPLEEAGLILPAKSQDRRERLLCVSTAGKRRLRQSYSLWEKAQAAFNAELSPADLERLASALQKAEATAEKMLKVR